MYTNLLFLRSLFGITIGIILSKYLNLTFNFLIPTIIFTSVFSNKKLTLKKFLLGNVPLILTAFIGLFLSKLLFNFRLLFFFTSFFIIYLFVSLAYDYREYVNSALLGFTYSTVYFNYSNININKIIDLIIVTTVSGIISYLLIFFIKVKSIDSKPSNLSLEKNNSHIFLSTSFIYLGWILFMILDLKKSFFAYAALCNAFTLIDPYNISKSIKPSIECNVIGCALASLFSFFTSSFRNNIFLFSLSIILIFYPILYNIYFNSNKNSSIFSTGLIYATLFPIGLYLTPVGDIFFSSFSRAFNIFLFLSIAFFAINLFSKKK